RASIAARNRCPSAATFRERGLLILLAFSFTRNPAGTVGRNPSGGFSRSGLLPADFVSNGAGTFGFCPCVTCATRFPPGIMLTAKRKKLRLHIVVAPLNVKNGQSVS